MRPVNGFVSLQPDWCVDMIYRSTQGDEAIGRACMPEQAACEMVRKGLAQYGHLAGVRAVSMCFLPSGQRINSF